MNDKPANKIQAVKYAPAPASIPSFGQENPREVCYFGRTNYIGTLEDRRFIFGIRRKDRRRHIYVVGKSGSGKSKMMELLARQDIVSGYGLLVLDSAGDIVENLLDYIPEERVADVCLIDPTDFQPAFNFLVSGQGLSNHEFAQGLCDIFAKLLSSNWNPQAEHLFRMATNVVLSAPGFSIADIAKILTDKEFRAVSCETADETTRKFFKEEYENWATRYEGTAVIPILNKFSQLSGNPCLKGFLHSRQNRISFENLVRENKIILVNIDRARLGEEGASFIEGLLLLKIREIANLRIKEGASQKDFYIYLDNFTAMLPNAMEALMSESKRSGISLTLSQQLTSNLPEKLQNSLISNIGTLVVFKVSAEDANKLKGEFISVFDTKDMTNLNVGEFYIKMAVEGEGQEPFSARSLKVLKHHKGGFASQIREGSVKNYGLELTSNTNG